jgi:nucleotide-binding universal stress UspA family protein
MLSHVLVPLDGSALAETALDAAKKIIGSRGKITLLTVVEAPEYPEYIYLPTPMVVPPRDDYAVILENLLNQGKDYLREIAKRLQSEGINVAIDAFVGDPADVILEVAQGLKVEAVVICTHGRSGFSRWLYGSVTQKVLSAATCPVLVVPNPEHVKTVADEQAQVEHA